jgi:hypothetical protein
MKQQPESVERRGMASELFLVLAGVVEADEVRAELRRGGLDLQRISLPDGGDRFLIIERRNGRVWDSFTFYGEESLSCCISHGPRPSVAQARAG